MKRLVVVLLFLSFGLSKMYAQSEYRNEYGGVLRVRLIDNYPITIALDGRYFQKHGPSLTIGDLPPGKHFLKIYTYTPRENSDAKAHLVFEGRVKVFADGVTYLVYDPTNGDMQVSKGDRESMEPGPGRVRGRQQVPYYNQNNEHRPAAPVAEPVKEDVKVPDAKLTKPAYAQISKDALNKLGNKINAKITDTDKLKELQSALAKKAISVEQLKLILTWLNFESSRVEFAKWAFPNLTDKQNFISITAGMKYAESKDELNKFLLQ